MGRVSFNDENATSTGNHTSLEADPLPFSKFAPTLAQCYFIVLIGYSAARLKFLKASDMRSVTMFASYFAMTSIICVTLAEANLQDLRWELLAGLLVGKLIIFILVAGVTALITGNLGVAGLLAIFCAQSNDLPVGNPLISTLYRDARPDMVKYLFFIPSITTMFILPIGNMMIEYHKVQRTTNREDEDNQSNKTLPHVNTKIISSVIYNHLMNPVILSTTAGVILNLCCGAKLPGVLHQPINVVATTMPGLALMILGFGMFRRERYIITSAVTAAFLLLVVKMILTPVVLHLVVKFLSNGKEGSKHLTDFTLLYGIISPATAIFQMGQEFRKPLAVMSVTLIVSSFMCFPTSYVIAKLTMAPVSPFNFYIPSLQDVVFYAAILSLGCNILVWTTLLRRKLLWSSPCCYVTSLAFAQVLVSCGFILWCKIPTYWWSIYCQVILYYTGELTLYFWTTCIALVMVFSVQHSALAKKSFSLLWLAAFGLSALITVALCFQYAFNAIDKVMLYGSPASTFEYSQLAIVTIILALCITIIGTCLVCHCRISTNQTKEIKSCNCPNDIHYLKLSSSKLSVIPCNIQSPLTKEEELTFYYEDVIRRGLNDGKLAFGREWTFRVFSLLFFLWVTMITKFVANVFKLAQNMGLEITVPLEFVQATLFVGQGVFTFFTFAVDIRTFSLELAKWFRKLSNGKGTLHQEISETEYKDAIQTCHQFYASCYKSCLAKLAKERLWKSHFYRDSFWGHQLVDWLIEEGLCKDDIEAEEFGQKLLLGGAICHVKSSHDFYNAPYLYYFAARS